MYAALLSAGSPSRSGERWSSPLPAPMPDSFAAAAGLAQEAKEVDAYASLAAGIAVGLGSVGAGIAVSGTGAAAIGAVAEKPDFLGRSLIFVGLAEGIAIYGLLIAFLVLFT